MTIFAAELAREAALPTTIDVSAASAVRAFVLVVTLPPALMPGLVENSGMVCKEPLLFPSGASTALIGMAPVPTMLPPTPVTMPVRPVPLPMRLLLPTA